MVEETNQPEDRKKRCAFNRPGIWILLGFTAASCVLLVFAGILLCVYRNVLTDGQMLLISAAAAAVGGGLALFLKDDTRVKVMAFYCGGAASVLVMALIGLMVSPPTREECFPPAATETLPSLITDTFTPTATKEAATDTATAAPMTLAPSATREPSERTGLRQERVAIEAGKSADVFEGDLVISVIAISFEGDPLRHLVSASYGSPGRRSLRIDQGDVGETVVYDAAGPYEVRIVAVDAFEASFLVTRLEPESATPQPSHAITEPAMTPTVTATFPSAQPSASATMAVQGIGGGAMPQQANLLRVGVQIVEYCEGTYSGIQTRTIKDIGPELVVTARIRGSEVETMQSSLTATHYEDGPGSIGSSPWLPLKVFSSLAAGESPEFRVLPGGSTITLGPATRTTYRVVVDGTPVDLEALEVHSSQEDLFIVLNDPNNPYVLKFVAGTYHYARGVQAFATGD